MFLKLKKCNNNLFLNNVSNIFEGLIFYNIFNIKLYYLNYFSNYLFYNIYKSNKILSYKNFKVSHNVNFFLLNYYNFLKENKKFSRTWMLEYYMRSISYSYIGFYTNWSFLNLKKKSISSKYLSIFNKVVKSNRFRFLKVNKRRFYYIFLQLTFLKNVQLLVEVFQQHLRKEIIKRHKSYFYKIRNLLTLWFYLCSRKKIVKGYSLYFKGKLGKKGSVRKKKIFFKIGKISFTNKNLCVSYKSYNMGTITGVVGANVCIFFNVYVHINIYIYSLVFYNTSFYLFLFIFI